MKIQVLIATMHQDTHDLLGQMNVQTDAIVVNQCERDEIELFAYKGSTIKWLSLRERGVGLSRNTALMRADADIVLFADDDVFFYNDYASVVAGAFARSPKADLIVFNLLPPEGPRKLPAYKDQRRVGFFNGMRYGTAHMAARLPRLRQENIHFSLLFGGGARYGSGEDSLFIVDCLKRRLKIYTCTDYIGGMRARESSWFQGYNEKYLFDRGALFYAISKALAYPLCLQMLIRHSEIWRQNHIGFFHAYKHMSEGIREMSKK